MADIEIDVTQNSNVVSVGGLSSLTAGTGLLADGTPGGTLVGSGTIAADLAPNGGGTANQLVRATDSRLSDARTPALHASSHASGGSDPVTLAQTQVVNLVSDLAAKVPTTRLVTAGTALTGGGALSTDVTLNVDLAPSGGGSATQAVSATDTRLSDARTPTSHGGTHGSAGSDPIPAGGLAQSQVANLVTDLAQLVPLTRQVLAGTGLTGGGDLTANVTLSCDFAVSGSATVGKPVQATDSRLNDPRTPTGAASGDLSGTYPSPTVNRFAGVQINTATPATNDVWRYTGTQWDHVAQTTLQTESSLSLYTAGFNGAATRTVANRLDNTLDVKNFGAVGDGTLHTVTEWFTVGSPWYRGYANLAAVQAQYPFVTSGSYSSDLAAINKALLILSQQRQSPPSAGGPSLSGWGMGEVYIPRGKYVLNDKIYVSDGTSSTTPASAIGVLIRGDGMWATNLIYTPFTGDLFHIKICLEVYLRDLALINNTAQPRASWTSNAIRIESIGGGKLFQMDRCFVRNFNIGIRLDDTVNNDTNKINNCWFELQNTFLYTRNSQALINEINSCTVYQAQDKVLDVAGFGYTTFNNGDIVGPGTLLYLAFGAGLTGTSSQYTFVNTKLEFWPQTGNAGTTRIVVAEDNVDNMASVRFIGCGIAGSTPDPSVFQWDINGGKITIDVDGGDWEQTKIRTKAQLGRSAVGSSWITFRNCVNAPSTTITRTPNAVDGLCQHIPVSFKNCRNVDDICLKGPGTLNNCASAPGDGLDRNFNSKNANGVLAGGGAVFPTGATTHAFSTSGSPVLIDKIRVVATAGLAGVTEMRLQAFSDAGLTSQIGTTVTKTTGFTAPFVMEITDAAGKIAPDGIWVRVWQNNSNILVLGTVFVDTVSF